MRYIFNIPDSTYALVEAFRIKRGHKSTAVAIRELIDTGLEVAGDLGVFEIDAFGEPKPPTRVKLPGSAEVFGLPSRENDSLGEPGTVELRGKRGKVRVVNVDPSTIEDRTSLVNPAARFPVGLKKPVMGKDGKSGAPMLKGYNILERYDGDEPVWRFEERKT